MHQCLLGKAVSVQGWKATAVSNFLEALVWEGAVQVACSSVKCRVLQQQGANMGVEVSRL